jgi:RNA polymerase sigma-70 factor (ECF subfamily)
VLREGVNAAEAVGLAVPSAVAWGIEGARAAFEQAYDSTFPHVYGYVRWRIGNPDVADDLTSQSFLRALDRLETFDPRKAEIGQWILGIARNVVRDHLRARRRWGWLPLDWLGERATSEPDPEHAAIRNERDRHLLDAIRGLSDRERDVLGLKFGAGLTNRAIASVTGLRESHVGVIVYRALGRLRTRLEGRGVSRA